MDVVARAVLAVVGAGIVFGVLGSAIRTVVVPRADPALLTKWVFEVSRWVFQRRARRAGDWERSDLVMARYAPTSLLLLPVVWVALVLIGFAPIYWAMGAPLWDDAFVISGSSLLTLGFAFRSDLDVIVLQFAEATIGLGLVALLISFLPSMYSQFSRREVLVAQLETRAGSPPTPAELLRRAHVIDWLPALDDLWNEWEQWFVEIEEAHTTFTALNFFRSPHHERSWITAAGCVLDTAAIRASTLDLPRSFHAELCMRSGFLALRRIADQFEIPYDPDPAPDDPISISRDEFLQVYRQLADVGVPVRSDTDRAWQSFAGWRVNYDTVLLALCGLTVAPYAPWSSDRSPARVRPPLRPRWRR